MVALASNRTMFANFLKVMECIFNGRRKFVVKTKVVMRSHDQKVLVTGGGSVFAQVTPKNGGRLLVGKKLEFWGCSFSDLECDVIYDGKWSQQKTSVSHIQAVPSLDHALYSALGTALPPNSTLRHLELLGRQDNDDLGCLSTVLLAFGKNTALKTLNVAVCDSILDRGVTEHYSEGWTGNECNA
jgi:hypothetical protein